MSSPPTSDLSAYSTARDSPRTGEKRSPDRFLQPGHLHKRHKSTSPNRFSATPLLSGNGSRRARPIPGDHRRTASHNDQIDLEFPTHRRKRPFTDHSPREQARREFIRESLSAEPEIFISRLTPPLNPFLSVVAGHRWKRNRSTSDIPLDAEDEYGDGSDDDEDLMSDESPQIRPSTILGPMHSMRIGPSPPSPPESTRGDLDPFFIATNAIAIAASSDHPPPTQQPITLERPPVQPTLYRYRYTGQDLTMERDDIYTEAESGFLTPITAAPFKSGSRTASPPSTTPATPRFLEVAQIHPGIGLLQDRQIVAKEALEFVNGHEKELEESLSQLGYQGEYMIQVGFHEELLKLGLRHEMLVFTLFSDFNASETDAADVLDQAYSPFVVAIQSPNQNFYVPLKLNSLKSEETPTPPLSSSWGSPPNKGNPDPPAGSQGTQNGGGGESLNGGSKGKGKGKAPSQETQRDNDEFDGDEREDGDSSRNIPEQMTGLDSGKSIRRSLENHLIFNMSVPSQHANTDEDYFFSLDLDFLIEAVSNSQGEDPPVHERPDRKWRRPWSHVDLASIGAASGPTELYTLKDIETRMTATPGSIETLYYHPKTTHAHTDSVRIKSESKSHNKSAGHMGITEPFLSFQHENGETESKEFEHKRWRVESSVRPQQETVVFSSQFVHNPVCSPVRSENFNPGPRIGYGYNTEDGRRTIGISMKVLWSSTTNSGRPKALDFVRFLSKRHSSRGESAQPLIFANFEQELSFEVDLEKLEPGSARMQNPNIVDRVDRADLLAGNRKKLPGDLRQVHSNFKIEMQRAIRGDINGREKFRFELESR